MFSLEGKNALVTGATGGIGGDIARALHAQGATVALSGTRKEKLDALAAELGDRVHVLPCNLSDGEAVDALPKQAAEAMGSLDILVANAGITKDQLLMRMKDEDWSDVLKVNLESYFRLSRAALRGMMKSRWGRIIGITSVVGVTGNPGQTNYSAAKAGIVTERDLLPVTPGLQGKTQAAGMPDPHADNSDYAGQVVPELPWFVRFSAGRVRSLRLRFRRTVDYDHPADGR